MIEVTCAGGIVLNNEGKVAVVNQNHETWSLPKGHVKGGESLEAAARREITEETGLTELELVKFVGSFKREGGSKKSPTGRAMKTIHIFLCRTTQMKLKPQDPKHPEARWVDRKEVAEVLTLPQDREFFLSVKNQLPL